MVKEFFFSPDIEPWCQVGSNSLVMTPTVTVTVWVAKSFRLWGYRLGILCTHELLEIDFRITAYTYVTVVQKKPFFSNIH
jgi:hypothetical protein